MNKKQVSYELYCFRHENYAPKQYSFTDWSYVMDFYRHALKEYYEVTVIEVTNSHMESARFLFGCYEEVK